MQTIFLVLILLVMGLLQGCGNSMNSAGPLSESWNSPNGPTAPLLNYYGSSGTSGNVGVPMRIEPSMFSNNGSSVLSCVASPELPDGLSIDNSDCVISGTPTRTLAITIFSIRASNLGGSTDASVTLFIGPSPPVLSYESSTGVNGIVGMPMSVTPSTLLNQGSAIKTCTIAPALPNGMSINTKTCVITGTPVSALSSQTYNVTATNGVGADSAEVILSVSMAAPLLDYNSGAVKTGNVGVPFTITPNVLNPRGSPITSCTIVDPLPSWGSIHNETCVISGTPDSILEQTEYEVTATNALGSVTASVTIKILPSLPQLSYAGATGTNILYGDTLSISPTTLVDNGSAITDCKIKPSTTALPAWASIDPNTCEISGVSNATLPQTTFTIIATNEAGNSQDATIQIKVDPNTPLISYESSTGKEGNFGSPMNVEPSDFNNRGSPITGCSISPVLPAGLEIHNTSCVIFGTPNETLSSTTFTVTATNSVGTTDASITLIVNSSAPLLSYEESTGINGAVATEMNVTPSTLNDQGSAIATCTASPDLPATLSIDNETCVISGTPTEPLSETTYTIMATNESGSTEATVTLSVVASVPELSYEGATGTETIFGEMTTIAPTTLNTNGAPLTSCAVKLPTTPLPSWASIDGTTCTITGIPDEIQEATSYIIVATNSAGDSEEASVSITVTANSPLLSFENALGTGGSVGVAMSVSPTTIENQGSAIATCTASPDLPATLSIDNETCVISGTPAEPLSETTYTITATNDIGPTDASVTLVIGASAPIISYENSSGTSGSVSTLMTVTPSSLNDQGSAIASCTASPTLPDSLSIDSETCVISGTPTEPLSETTYTITATNGVGSTTATVTLSVGASVPELSYSGSTGTSGSVGTLMSVTPSTLNNQGSAIATCTASPDLPVTLSIDNETCVISGTPTETLTSTTYTITATNGVGPTTATVTLSVGASVPELSYSASTGTTGSVGTMMSVTPSTLNDQGSVINTCAASPELPATLSIDNETCVISGTPTEPLSETTYTITATNGVGSTTATVTLSVGASVPELSYSASTGTSGSVGTMMSVTPSTLNNQGSAIATCAASPDLPVTLSIDNETCVISGTPTETLASTTYTITATNGVGPTTATVTLSVGASVPELSYSGASGTNAVVGVMATITPTTLNNNGSQITSCAIKVPTTSLPSWASIDATTCAITGLPDEVQSETTYTIIASNSAGDSSDATVSITVTANTPLISYSGATGTTGNVGESMSVAPTTLNTRGSSITNCTTSQTLPDGLDIDISTCVISGTPTETLSETTYTVTATNSIGTESATVSLSVSASVPELSYSGTSENTATFGVALTITPTTLKNNGAMITSCGVKIPTTALPSWATIDQSTCVISGTPDSTQALTTYTIVASNSVGTSEDASVSITVNPNTPLISYSGATGTSGYMNEGMSISPTTLSSRGASITCSISPDLPDGLGINTSTCVISGTPTTFSTSTEYTITATNTAGSTTAQVSIEVLPKLVANSFTATSFNEDTSSSIRLNYTKVGGLEATSCTVTDLVDVSISEACSCTDGACLVGVVGAANYHGSASFSFTVSNNGVSSNTASASLTIDPVIDISGSLAMTNIAKIDVARTLVFTDLTIDQKAESVSVCLSEDTDMDNVLDSSEECNLQNWIDISAQIHSANALPANWKNYTVEDGVDGADFSLGLNCNGRTNYFQTIKLTNLSNVSSYVSTIFSAWDPTCVSIPGVDITLWLDADEASTLEIQSGKVLTWTSRIGSNYLEQTDINLAPSYLPSNLNNRAQISFDGDYLQSTELPYPLDSEFTLFHMGGTIYADSTFILGNWVDRAWGLKSEDKDFSMIIGDTPYSSNVTATTQGPYVKSLVRGADYIQSFVNGYDSTSTPTEAGRVWADSHQLSEDVITTHSEIIIFKGVVDLSSQEQIEGYLAWKWGQQGNLKSTHPYKDAPP